jgi:hypothetical protein
MRCVGALFIGRVVDDDPSAALFAVVAPFAMAGVAAGAVVELATGSGRGGKDAETVMLPAERLRRSMLEKPRPPVPLLGALFVGVGCMRVDTIGPRRRPEPPLGDGGDGDSSRWSLPVLT